VIKKKTIEWKGLKTTNPFFVPKATFLFLTNSKNYESSKQYVPIEEVYFKHFALK
jgi:hypothetical protein